MQLPKVILKVEDEQGNFIVQSGHGKYGPAISMLRSQIVNEHPQVTELIMYIERGANKIKCDFNEGYDLIF